MVHRRHVLPQQENKAWLILFPVHHHRRVRGRLATIAPNQDNTALPTNHKYDKVATVRVDIKCFWNVKLEGHFIDGYPNAGYLAGFYPKNNPGGFLPHTNALVIKTGFNF